MSREWKILGALVAIFVVAYTLPLGNPQDSGGDPGGVSIATVGTCATIR
ncbi:MAG: hypothetical protein NUV86_00895 [Candidatus Scalindua sp.]|nr:hypothetical protein [Candidatus Scalindua sp.]MCR4343325.1 hypothetical protein [Candidatus Scalindua sp.]